MEVVVNQKKYRIFREKLGQGAHGSVFRIDSVEDNESLALKIMQSHTQELDILEKLSKFKNFRFPKVVSRFKENGYECVAMTLLGISLKALKNVNIYYNMLMHIIYSKLFGPSNLIYLSLDAYINKGSIGLNSVLNIFYQSLECLENLHQEGYIHCDIKPENILLGRMKDYKSVYLIDFSLSEKYVDEDGEPLEEPAHSVFKGSISFCSRKVLNGQYPCRADDLESLLYSMMYILNGHLPWLPRSDMTFADAKEKKDFVIKQK